MTKHATEYLSKCYGGGIEGAANPLPPYEGQPVKNGLRYFQNNTCTHLIKERFIGPSVFDSLLDSSASMCTHNECRDDSVFLFVPVREPWYEGEARGWRGLCGQDKFDQNGRSSLPRLQGGQSS